MSRPDAAARPHAYRVHQQTEHFSGPLFRLVTDTVQMPDGELVARDYLRHVGAVAVVPYDERTDRVVLVYQYRHPVGHPLWELPAGLADVAGEALPDLARRELAEEADLTCGRLDLLLDVHPTPGCSDEWIRIFLARDLRSTPAPHPRRHEEATMRSASFPLAEAVRMVLSGQITNAAAVAGVLATARARDETWAPLRQVDAPPPPQGPDLQ